MLSMDTSRTLIGIIGNVTALVLYLSPLPTVVKIWKKKSVQQYSAATYLATFLNCGIWVLYGLPTVHPNSFLVMTTSAAGVAIEVVFLFVFLFCSDRKKRFRVGLIVLAEVAFMAALSICVITLAHTWKLRSAIVGSTAVVSSVLMYGSPLAIMKLVITTKSVEYMPLSVSLCSFANSLCWIGYAFIQFDPYILAPNSMGALSGLVQLVLYIKYYKSNKIVEEKQVDMEVGMTNNELSTNTKKPSSEG
nr:bidirectional sugar transporter SWEET4-like [Ipomoea batatas]